MAKLKKTPEVAEALETAEETALVDMANEQPTEEAVAQESEMPEKVKDLLKSFHHLEEAYIDAQGGVFSKNSDKSIRGAAVLYKNPYFHK